MKGQNRIRRPQKFRWHGRKLSRKPGVLPAQLALVSHLASASVLVPPFLPYPFSLPFLYFLYILRQVLTVEPEIALISGSPPAASVFQVLGLHVSHRTWLCCPALPLIFTMQVFHPLECSLKACFLPQHYIPSFAFLQSFSW